MKSQLKTQNRDTAAGGKGFVVFIALFRLALLVGPEAAVVKLMAQSPVICVLACFLVLTLWLCVDVWPFRPATAAVSAPAKRTQTAFGQNLTKAQWWSYLSCRIIVFCALFHSKLTI